jgi:hypothetical protein
METQQILRITGFFPSSGILVTTQNYWGFGLCPSSGILVTRKHRFGKWICFRPQVSGGDTYSVRSVRKSLSRSLDFLWDLIE